MKDISRLLVLLFLNKTFVEGGYSWEMSHGDTCNKHIEPQNAFCRGKINILFSMGKGM